MVKEILIYPNKFLRTKTQEVEQLNSEILQLALDLIDTMRYYDGLGISANQIGKIYRLCAIDLDAVKEGKGFLVLANPTIVYKEGIEIDEEGCLSFPELYVKIQRASFIIVRAKKLNLKTRTFEDFEIQAKGLLARAIQHEIDHLNGILIIDYISPEKRAIIMKDWMDKIKTKQITYEQASVKEK
ncbi:MAG: peptide deformylase [candidate division WOR-3 bacterium]|nr:peptide deformylase [candidate division WOR-3 bacterium]MDW8150449.1 peptide deformylase [candidate division WOR-3 bacterium]